MSEVRAPDAEFFLWIAASVADASAVNPNGIKTLSANSLSTYSIKGDPGFSNGPKSLPRNPPDCPILSNWIFNNFISADEPFAKALWSFKNCVLVNSNYDENYSLESAITYDEILKVTSVPFLIPHFHLLSCQLDNLTFKVLYWAILYWYYIKIK